MFFVLGHSQQSLQTNPASSDAIQHTQSLHSQASQLLWASVFQYGLLTALITVCVVHYSLLLFGLVIYQGHKPGHSFCCRVL
jgi:hypothetical protein